MKRPVYKWLALAAIAIAFVGVGYLRDFIAVNLNYHLHYLQTDAPYSSGHSFFDFLNRFTFQQVYYSKYVMTVIFTTLNFALGWILLRAFAGGKMILKIFTGIYLVVITFAVLFFGGGYLLNMSEDGYMFSRILMGFLQSPVPAVMLVFGYPLYLQSVQR